jgi:hypothetical protein
MLDEIACSADILDGVERCVAVVVGNVYITP